MPDTFFTLQREVVRNSSTGNVCLRKRNPMFKQFSFVELLVAAATFGVVVAPVLASFGGAL
jgi:hypothetical protein